MSREDALRREISWFLATNNTIDKINFIVKKRYKVYPSAYKRDVSNAIKGERIAISIGSTPPGSIAMYEPNEDTMTLHPLFSITDWKQQSNLIHESTHIHIDLQAIGDHSAHEDEAVAFLAQAVYIVALKKEAAMKKCYFNSLITEVAKKILSGGYWVSDEDSNRVITAIKNLPLYKNKTTYPSNSAWTFRSWFNPMNPMMIP